MPKDTIFSTPVVEGIERACALFVVPTRSGNAVYRAYRWGRFQNHWLVETPENTQVEIYLFEVIINIPPAGFTFELDGSCREVRADSMLVVN